MFPEATDTTRARGPHRARNHCVVETAAACRLLAPTPVCGRSLAVDGGKIGREWEGERSERYRGPTYRPSPPRAGNRGPGWACTMFVIYLYADAARNFLPQRRRGGRGNHNPIRAVVLPKGPSPLLCSRTGSCHHRHHVRTHSAEMVYRVRATKFLEMPSCKDDRG